MPRPKKSIVTDSREILYPEVKVSNRSEDRAITCAQAEQLLGWHEVQDGDTGEFLLRDGEYKIRCSHNIRNRPLYSSQYNMVIQEILRKRWQLNGEPIIIGKTGLVLNGQHTLIGFVLACRKYDEAPEEYLEWEEEPTLEKVIVFGIEETDEVINTMDTCKPRSLSDVLYRSEHFSNKKSGARKKASSACDHAIRQLWSRTGVPNAFGIQRTHAESLAFLAAHPKLLECVSFIMEEDSGKEKKLSRYMTPGYCSALLYLMGCSASDESYFNNREETELNWENWDKACEFFVLLSSGKEGTAVRKALGKILEDGDSTLLAKISVLIKAWNLFADGKPITTEKLKLKYHTSEDESTKLIDFPSIGGIDIAITVPSIDEELPTQEEIQERANEIKRESIEMKAKPRRTRKKTSTKSKSTAISVGDVVWCVNLDDPAENWSGEYVSDDGKTARIIAGKGFVGAGTEFDWPVSQVQKEKP